MGLAAILAKLNGVALFQIVKEMKRRVERIAGRREDETRSETGQGRSILQLDCDLERSLN
jgi:hypothetical protein